ncbi:GGDEF domain-containing protein [Clostridium sp. 19966]|uniref:GGDEF domain-containing protein n=1 Tax=Clostridium sp. 19966 TaxID=2768166 RepID=UPI0028E058CD|nr:GGDEF domain-containing protein [Clostridium sp. 19966]MDT8718238.1 GGDEF domain-containing protein [Clostridium sp. 19966]
MVIILLIIILFVSVIIYVDRKNKYQKNVNSMLKEIINISLKKNEEYDITNSYYSIIKILKKYYNIDFCTIFNKKIEAADNYEYEIVSTNVSGLFTEDIQEYVNKKIPGMAEEAEIMESNNTLSYVSAERRGVKFSYLIPLNQNNGAIYIENINKFKYDKEIFLVVAEIISLVIENFNYTNQISELAMKDTLTKVYNRNYMQKHLTEKINGNRKFSLVLGDIDYFKKINDTYGHTAGDIVLKTISKLIQDKLGEQDRIYRYGGEEFLIYFDNNTEKKSLSVMELIRKEIETTSILCEAELINVTMSFGIYQFDKENSIGKAIEKADKALYFSKDNGRNQITLYSDINRRG